MSLLPAAGRHFSPLIVSIVIRECRTRTVLDQVHRKTSPGSRVDRTRLIIEITSRNNECAQYVARVPFAQAGALGDLADMDGPAPCGHCRPSPVFARISWHASHIHFGDCLGERAGERAVAHACGELPRAHCSCSLSEISLPSRNPVATFPSESSRWVG